MSFTLRKATPEEEATLFFNDYSALTSVYTCPTKGVFRYGQKLALKGGGRSMPLEAGRAAHEVFAATRVWKLIVQQGLPSHGMEAMVRMWGEDFAEDMMTVLHNSNHSGVEQGVEFIMHRLYTCGFYDSPHDKRRTMTNLETSLYYYFHKAVDHPPVFVSDEKNPDCFIGVEQGFKFVIEQKIGKRVTKFGFWGKIDGVHVCPQRGIVLAENKTTWRIDDAFRVMFDMTHQITGYKMVASILSGHDVTQGDVYALTVPLPAAQSNGYERIGTRRNEDQRQSFFRWFTQGARMLQRYNTRTGLMRAPRYTHSCNQFFRACSLIPFCTGDRNEQRYILDNDVKIDIWDPTAKDIVNE